MQTIKGEKLLNVLDNYNFESDNSRYVISLSDTAIEDLDDEEVLNDVAQKIIDKNITFIGLGDENSSEQYQQIAELIPENAHFYEYSDKTAINTIKNNIIDTEEAKRILDSDAVVATNLTITGKLPDGSSLVQQYDELHEGETISFVIPVDLDNLTSGVDAILLKNIRLDYTDENNNARIKTLDKITLPVIGSDGKITNQVSSDKATYYEHENVSIFDRIHNNSDIRAAKGLTNVISIIDSEGNVINEFSKPLSEIMTKSYVEVSEIWNVADQPEGQYTIISNVYDGEVLVAESQAVIEVLHHELPQYELTGYLNTSGKNLPLGANTITHILERLEYCGHTVNFRTKMKSYKVHKIIYNPEDEWQIFENTQEPIITQETFDLVQELRKNKRRPQKCEIVNPFAGMVCCADCGEKMYLSRRKNERPEQEHMRCSTYAKEQDKCTVHYIRTCVLNEIVLGELNKLLTMVRGNEEEFVKRVMSSSVQRKSSELTHRITP